MKIKKIDVIDPQVVVTTWQSVFKQPKEWFEQFGFYLGDEAHTGTAKSLQTISSNLVNAEYRIGTTGTLDNEKVHKLVLEGSFGPTYEVITTRELMDSGSLADLSIDVLLLQYDKETCKAVKGLSYQDEIDFIVRHEKRNNLIKNLSLQQKGNTLVLFQFVEKHGKPLYKSIIDACTEDRTIVYVSGETDVDDRELVRKICTEQNDVIIVASLAVFSTGINIPSLENIIFASPTKSQIKVLQSIGRGLRKHGDKKAKLYDIVDDFSDNKKTKNFALTHSAERIKIYSKQKFEFKIYQVPITS
jgi:superfamily II DNA or RNA helicase